MAKLIAEQKLANYLFRNGIIKADDDITVIRLDWKSPFTILKNGKGIGICQFNGYIYNQLSLF